MENTYRLAVRSLDLVNFLTTRKGYKIRSVRDGRDKYKVFYFDNAPEVHDAITEWIAEREGKFNYSSESERYDVYDYRSTAVREREFTRRKNHA